MNRESVQGAFRRATMAAGANIRFIQHALEHRCLETTMKYLHPTRNGQANAYQLTTSVMESFPDEHRR